MELTTRLRKDWNGDVIVSCCSITEGDNIEYKTTWNYRPRWQDIIELTISAMPKGIDFEKNMTGRNKYCTSKTAKRSMKIFKEILDFIDREFPSTIICCDPSDERRFATYLKLIARWGYSIVSIDEENLFLSFKK